MNEFSIESTSISRTWFENVGSKTVFHFVSFLLVEAPTFVKRSLWVVFHEADGLQNEQSFPFQVFEASELSKSLIFVNI